MTTRSQGLVLDELVKEAIFYRFKEAEAIEYIRIRTGGTPGPNGTGGTRVKPRAYRVRKARMQSDETAQNWLNEFTRIGFVKNHMDQIETIRRIQDQTIQEWAVESNKQFKDPKRMAMLRNDIRENARLLSDLTMDSPHVASIKAKVDKANAILQASGQTDSGR